MNIQRTDDGTTVIFNLQEDGDRIRSIGFIVDEAGRGHRLAFTNGLVDGRIASLPIGMLFQYWKDLALDQACHLCAWEEAIAKLGVGWEGDYCGVVEDKDREDYVGD